MPGYNEAPNPVTMMGYDPVTHLFVPVQFQTVATDPFNQELYGQLVGGGGGGGGGAVTAIAGAFVDGAIVTIGAKNDTAWDGVAASASEIQILKKLVAQLAAALSVNVANMNPNGQTTMSASAPVSVASDQSPIAVKNQPVSAVLFSTTQTGVSTWAGSGDITIPSGCKELFINMNITAITGTSIQLRLQRKDSFGNWITVNTGSALTSTGTTATSWGAGLSINHSFGNDIQLIVVFNAITSVTFTLDMFAK